MFRMLLSKQLFLLLLLVFPQLVHAEKKVYVIGVEDVAYYPLYDFTDDKNNHAKALLDAFARQSGYTFTYIPLPIKRFDNWLEQGRVDFRYPDSPLWHDKNDTKYQLIHSQPVINLVSGTIILAENSHWQESNIKSIGTLLGFHPTFWSPEINAGEITLVQHPSTTVLVQQLLHGYVDALDLEPSVVQEQLRFLKKSPEAAMLAKHMRYQVYNYRLSTIKYPEVIKQFDRFLKQNPELLKQLRQQYRIIDHTPFLK